MISLFSSTSPVVMRDVLGCIEARLHTATSWTCAGGKWVRNGDEPLADDKVGDPVRPDFSQNSVLLFSATTNLSQHDGRYRWLMEGPHI